MYTGLLPFVPPVYRAEAAWQVGSRRFAVRSTLKSDSLIRMWLEPIIAFLSGPQLKLGALSQTVYTVCMKRSTKLTFIKEDTWL
jgi:hypothetical protein